MFIKVILSGIYKIG